MSRETFSFKSEQPIQKIYFKISEVAINLNETQPTIRYWSTVFNIGHRAYASNWRVFTDRDIIKFMRVQHLLRTERYTIEGAKKQL